MAAVGVTMFWVITWLAVAVHPLGEVTVTVYVPAVVTVKVAVVAKTAVPLDQEYVPPPEAVNGILVVVHVSILVIGTFIPAVGGVIF